MRRFLFGTAALILLAGPAVCDDVRRPVYEAPPPALPSWHWTGCFAGGQADGLWGRSSQWIVRTPGGAFFGESLGENEVEGWGGERARCFELADRHGKAGRWVFAAGETAHVHRPPQLCAARVRTRPSPA